MFLPNNAEYNEIDYRFFVNYRTPRYGTRTVLYYDLCMSSVYGFTAVVYVVRVIFRYTLLYEFGFFRAECRVQLQCQQHLSAPHSPTPLLFSLLL
jgi:hypothetical protein